MKGLLAGILLFLAGQILIWFQTNGQFLSEWAKKHPLIMSVVGGTIISYMFIKATGLIAAHYEGLIWPGRFIGFGTGMIAFSILTYLIMGEGITTKTLISLILATTLVALQIFWK